MSEKLEYNEALGRIMLNIFSRCPKCELPYRWNGPICKCAAKAETSR